jgi:hypothetical protein
LKNKQLIFIFTRNPELGKVKTRLAKTIGNENALEIYCKLLAHTKKVTQNLQVDKAVYYSVKIRDADIWDKETYLKFQQKGADLGERMKNAFQDAFKQGYEKVIVIGSDLYDITQEDIEEAFSKLTNQDAVIGPAQDGGYYLLGLTKIIPELFSNKAWGTDSVLKDSLANLKDKKHQLLNEKNDIDIYDDIKDIAVFQPFLQQINQ